MTSSSHIPVDIPGSTPPERTVVVQIRGGMGNQLFQYAAARHLAHRYGVELELDIGSYVKPSLPHRVLDTRPYCLRYFRITGRERSAYKRELGRRLIQQGRFDYDPEFENLPAYVYLKGYWQSEKYFLGSEDVIRQELKPCDPEDVPPEAIRAQQASNVVAINVRRGDYLKVPEKHPPVSISYLKSAMAEFGSRYDFLVISDDIEWCQKNLKGDRVAFSVGRSDIHNFWLMAHCCHHIIANSTYCWWAAWLGASPKQRVIAPKNWFGPDYAHLDTSDIYPPGWVVMAD